MQVVSTRIRSASSQVVEVRQLLPVQPSQERDGQASPGSVPGSVLEPGPGEEGRPEPANRLGYFEFEPDVEELLARLIPLYVEASIYGALLEASASEHAARQRAMAAATENADELLKTLRRVMNRARQDTITTEIMEIVGGSEALRSSGAHHHELTYPPATEETA